MLLCTTARIYNYPELREELTRKGYSFRTQTDTEVLAAAFDYWREHCLQQFDGMFAFAIWDEKENEFFAARDRFGEKPFHYIYDAQSKTFLFASEIKAFWSIGKGKEFNKRMLFNFLTIGYTDNPNQPGETFYEEVNKLPSASFLKIRFNQDLVIKIEKYWDVDLGSETNAAYDGEAIAKFRGLFIDSVKRRLRSDVPLGTSLSGGLDSSSIAVTINEIQIPAAIGVSSKLKTFSAIFPAFEKNEEKYIDEVTQRFALNSFKVVIEDRELPGLFQKIITCQDEPFGSASLVPQYKTFQLAKQNNVTVLLDGQGADETIGGYHKYYKWYWQELFRKRRLARSRELKRAKELEVMKNLEY